MTLDELSREPERAASLSAKERVDLYRQVARMEADLLALMLTDGTVVEPRDEAPDQLLTAAQVGARLGYTRDWVYRHADSLPFTVRIAGGRRRFSGQGLARYLRRHPQ